MYLLLWITGLAASILFGLRHFERQGKWSHQSPGLLKRTSDLYFGTFQFFLRPVYFLAEAIEEARDAMITFKIRSSTVVILRGLTGRDAFFSKGLDFMSGYRLLNPQLVDVMPATEISGDESWASFMAKFIRSEVLQQLYPQMMNDVTRLMATWGDDGIVNPFEAIDELIFSLSARIGTCTEFCEHPEKINTFRQIFKDLEAGSSPSAILFPWFPTPARIRRTLAGAKMYYMITEVVRTRREQDRREDDPLQVLIDNKFTLVEITRFVAMLLFASVTNTGGVLGWVLIYLQNHPVWKDRISQEMGNLTQNSESYIEEIEQATPNFELCVNETLRLIFTGTFMRRNIGRDLNVAGLRIPHGTYLMYPTGDLHFDPTLFPNPQLFDPTRFKPEIVEERKRAGINFLGWGAARHTCVGRRAAFLMMRIVLQQLFTEFDIQLVDNKGDPLNHIPPTSYDVLFKVCPPGAESRVFLKYKRKRMFT